MADMQTAGKGRRESILSDGYDPVFRDQCAQPQGEDQSGGERGAGDVPAVP